MAKATFSAFLYYMQDLYGGCLNCNSYYQHPHLAANAAARQAAARQMANNYDYDDYDNDYEDYEDYDDYDNYDDY